MYYEVSTGEFVNTETFEDTWDDQDGQAWSDEFYPAIFAPLEGEG